MPRRSSARSRCSASPTSSACPAARSSPSTTRCSTAASSGTSSCATSRAPATRPRATRRRAASSASRSRPRAPVPPTSSRRSPTRTWTRCPILAITGQVFSNLMGTDAFQEADIVGITMPITKHSFLVKRRRGHPRHDRGGVPHRHHRTPRPRARRHHEGRAAGEVHVPLAAEGRPARLPPDHEGPRQAGRRGGADARRGEAPGALRGRRHHPLARVGGAASRSPRRRTRPSSPR